MTEAITVQCPDCGSSKVYCNGHRTLRDGSDAQRFLCRGCGLRFTYPQALKNIHANKGNCQVCETPAGETKNLDFQAIVNKAIAGEKTDLNTRLVEYAWIEKKRQLSETTISQRVFALNVLRKRGANLDNPDSVLTVLATEGFSEASKFHYIQAYISYAKNFNIPFTKPNIQYETKEQYTPKPYEVTTLIQNLSKQQGTLCQTLAETSARIGEMARLIWNEIDAQGKIIYINHPEKHSKARKIHVSEQCIAMLQKLPKKFGSNVFNPDKHVLQSSFARQRNRIAEKLDMPNLKNIHHHSFRRYFADQMYKKTRFNIRKVQARLGHKRLSSTEKYFGDVDTDNVTYETAWAYTIEEQEELRQLG
jgi:integrase